MYPIVQNFVALQPMREGLIDAAGLDVKATRKQENLLKTHGSARHLQRKTSGVKHHQKGWKELCNTSIRLHGFPGYQAMGLHSNQYMLGV